MLIPTTTINLHRVKLLCTTHESHSIYTPRRITPREHGRQEIEERGTGAIDFLRKAGGGCWAYGTKYTVGKILTVVASANVVVINFGLKARMGLNVAREELEVWRHFYPGVALYE